ncbi:MAG: DUF3347 domain-containing protein [Nitrosarchaeum sp.]|nr:DUF3347 domain-containing protein [Nitrosarchaeum sp.]
MKSIILMATVVLLSTTVCQSQVNNAKTETVKIYGNCGMCETKIETAGNIKKIAKVDWNQETNLATITYDSTKTNQDEILKRIALVGYDSDKFLAPDDVYAKLHGCCKYERVNKKEITTNKPIEDHSTHSHENLVEKKQETNQLKAVFDNYFTLKDALVKSDGSLASTHAKELLNVLNLVEMNKLSAEAHTVWMKILNDLKEDAEHINETKEISHQRDHFMSLSKNMYELIKVAKTAEPVYYQFCPMANNGKGANWLSKEIGVKNPYYGSQMLTCGKTVETIKQ